MLDYLKELRSSLIEAYSQITLGVQDSNTQPQFIPFLPKMFEFLYQAVILEKTQVSVSLEVSASKCKLIRSLCL